MSTETIIPLVGYLVALTLGIVWIALDAETGYIFDVFGKSFRYVWFESGERWRTMFNYGWRLVILFLVIVAGGFFAYRLALITSSGHAFTSWAVVVFLLLMVALAFLFPWIHLAEQLRYRRSLFIAARKLTPIVQRLSTMTDLSEVLDKAEYWTNPTWTSWHPRDMKEWPAVVPVAYVCASPDPAIIFPVDFKDFLAWKLTDQLLIPGTALPFCGPFETRYTMQGVRPLRGMPDWSIVRADIRWEGSEFRWEDGNFRWEHQSETNGRV